MQLAEAECSLSELVLQARMDMVDLADRADVTLACDIEPLAHDRVLVDAVRLSHVLTQLVGNAIKYSPAGSTVRISVAENAGAPQGFASFRFVVADKGVGMEPAFMERMFMPFERESNTTASGRSGHGTRAHHRAQRARSYGRRACCGKRAGGRTPLSRWTSPSARLRPTWPPKRRVRAAGGARCTAFCSWRTTRLNRESPAVFWTTRACVVTRRKTARPWG